MARGTGLSLFHPEQLRVICYHRIWRANDPRFSGYRPNISASPETFARQIDYLRTRFNPISASDLAKWLAGKGDLPPRPVLITFDDGYRDNAELAWPILKERGVPAVVFLATDHIGSGRPFAWDFAAYCFDKTTIGRTMVPLVGRMPLTSCYDRACATERWVEALKLIPAASRQDAMNALASALKVPPPPPGTFDHLYLSWPEVVSLAADGLDFGGHTDTHPILTRQPVHEASREIAISVEKVAAALGSGPLTFAYPNGSPRDYTRDHEEAARQSGVAMAFSLEPGPTQLACVRRNPMAIRRIYVGEHDNMLRFIAKMYGAARISNFLRRQCRRATGRSSRIPASSTGGIGHT